MVLILLIYVYMYGFELLLEKSLFYFGIFKVYDEKCGKKCIILFKVCILKKIK